MNELPIELKQLLLSNLPFEDLINLSKVNKQFNQALKFKLIPENLPLDKDNYLKALVQTYYKEMTQFAFQFPEKSDKIRELFIKYLSEDDIQYVETDSSEENYVKYITRALITKDVKTTPTPIIDKESFAQLKLTNDHPFLKNYQFIRYVKHQKNESCLQNMNGTLTSPMGEKMHALKGTYINLSGADLSGISIFYSKNLADFEQIDMTKMILTNVDLEYSYLPHVNLDNVDLSNSNLVCSTFYANSIGTTDVSTLNNANLSNATLCGFIKNDPQTIGAVSFLRVYPFCIQNKVLEMKEAGGKVKTNYKNMTLLTQKEYKNEILPELIRIRNTYEYDLDESSKTDAISNLINLTASNIEKNNISFHDIYKDWYEKNKSVINASPDLYARAKLSSSFTDFFTGPKDDMLESLKALEANAKQHAELLKNNPPKNDNDTTEITKNKYF